MASSEGMTKLIPQVASRNADQWPSRLLTDSRSARNILAGSVHCIGGLCRRACGARFLGDESVLPFSRDTTEQFGRLGLPTLQAHRFCNHLEQPVKHLILRGMKLGVRIAGMSLHVFHKVTV